MEFTFEFLEKSSLFVEELHSEPFKGGFYVSNYPSITITDLASLKDLPETREDHEICEIFPYKNEWYFNRWKYIPGPGEDDVRIKIDNVEQGIEFAYRSFFGKSMEIDGWLIPSHRHPEWDLDKLKKLLGNPKPLSSLKWNTLINKSKEEYYALVYKRMNFTTEMRSYDKFLFVSVYKREKDSSVLKVRRDLKVAYLVSA